MMVRKLFFVSLFIMLVFGLSSATATAQGPTGTKPHAPRAALSTAFTYQGQLKSGGSAYTGNCDMQFTLYDAASSGTQIGTTQTVPGVSVTNGLFTTTPIDFGAGAFDGNKRFLQIAVMCGGEMSYTTLAPLQELTATPYALFSANAAWSGLSGIPNPVTFLASPSSCSNGQVATWNGTTWTCTTSGWALTGNSGTTYGTNFLGTTNNVTLTLRANNVVGWRLAPSGANTPNVIGGYSGNTVTSGVTGATIGGGGNSTNLNSVTGSYSTVGGGYNNTAAGGSATVAGGDNNATGNDRATVGGGYNNHANGRMTTVGGGDSNTASNNDATVGGGATNHANNDYTTVGGGQSNIASNSYATVGGGNSNTASGYDATVGGGEGNTAGPSSVSTVPGGFYANASHYGEMAYASGRFAAAGDAQTSLYVVRGTTNNGSQTEIFLDGTNATSQRITIASNRTVTFDILITGRSQGGQQQGGKFSA